MNLLRRIRAFIIRDFQLAISYRFEFFIKLLWILGISTTFYFISRLANAGVIVFKYPNWQDLLAAWLTGLAMLNYFLVGFSALANVIRQEQMQGTLESVLLTPINVPTVILSSSAWAYVEASFYSFLYLFFGWLFFCGGFFSSFPLRTRSIFSNAFARLLFFFCFRTTGFRLIWLLFFFIRDPVFVAKTV